MKRFCNVFFDGVQYDTFFQSCGMADLITTCYGGRNRKCAEAFARLRVTTAQESSNHPNHQQQQWSEDECSSLWQKLENDLLQGQKLQGTLTCQEVFTSLSSRNMLGQFPLMKMIYDISFKGLPVEKIVDGIVVPIGITQRLSKL